jgi:predicted RND superfamily exporter protein
VSHGSSRLARAFLAVEQFARTHHRLVILVSIGVLLIGSALSMTLTFETDVMELLPQKDPAVKAFRETAKAFGSLDPFPIMLDAAKGYEAEDYEDFEDVLAARLREDPAVASVDVGLDMDSPLIHDAHDHLALLLGEASLKELRSRLSDGAIRAAVRDGKSRLLVVPAPELRELLRRDPVGLLPLLAQRIGAARGATRAGWQGGRIVSEDGNALMLVLHPGRPAQDVHAASELVGRVREAIATTTADIQRTDPDLPPPTVLLGGRYAVAVADNDLILSDLGRTMTLSFVGVVLLYLFCYRRWGAILYSVFPLVLGQCLTFTLAKLAFGSLNSATASTAALLMGLGTDFTIVMYARYVEERNAGRTVDQASRTMMGETALGVYTGALTSAGTFGALMVTSFVGLRQFGFLIGSGILLCLGSILLLLPALVMALEQHRKRTEPRLYVHSFGFERLIPWARSHPRIALAACAVVSIVALPLALDLKLKESVESLRSKNNAGLAAQEVMKERFGRDENAVMVVTRGSDPAEVERRARAVEKVLTKLRDEGRLERVEGLGSLLPTQEEQEATRTALLADPALDPVRVEATLRAALRENGLREEGFEDGIATLRRILRPESLVTEASIAAKGGADLVARFSRGGEQSIRASYAYGTWNDDIERAVRDADPQVTVAGVKLLTGSLKRILRVDVTKCLVLGLVIVAVLLALDFRSWVLAGMALTQLLVGLLWMLGGLRAFNVPLTMVNSFAAALLLGVGIDYGIHILHRLRGPDAGSDESVAETGKAVAIAALTNVVGFGVLLSSNYPGLRGMGAAAVMGSVGCMLTALVLLPALDKVVMERKARAKSA